MLKEAVLDRFRKDQSEAMATQFPCRKGQETQEEDAPEGRRRAAAG